MPSITSLSDSIQKNLEKVSKKIQISLDILYFFRYNNR
jgi:hypothetical protein